MSAQAPATPHNPRVATHIDPATYSMAETARLIGCSYSLLHQLCAEGRSPVGNFLIGNRRRFPRRLVDALVNGAPIEPTDRPDAA